MNTYRLHSMLNRQNVTSFTAFFSLLIVVGFGLIAGTQQSAAKGGAAGSKIQLPKSTSDTTDEDMAKEFNDDDLKMKGEKPRGKWGFATVFDRSQLESSSIPVAVSGIQSLSGGGKYHGTTKIKRIELRNKSSKIVNSVQLRWTLAPLDAPEEVLSEGTTQFANIWAEANSSKVVEIPTLYPALLLRSLAKDGVVDGRFKLTIGVQEARFADGSFWRRQETAAYLKLLDPYRSLGAGSHRSPR